jgi:hypothetical protein
MEERNDGIMEAWKNPTSAARSVFFALPVLQHSSTPVIQYSTTPINEGIDHA